MARTILLADDSKTIRLAVEIVFEKEPYEVVCVGNGDDALTRAKEIRPAIILADHLMPGRSGYELAAAIGADPDTAGIPVVLLTGSASPFDEARAQASGVAATIKKPFDCQSLIDRVDELLGGRASAAPNTAMPAFAGAPSTGAMAQVPQAPSAPSFTAPVAPSTPAPSTPTPAAPTFASPPVTPAPAPAYAPPSAAAAATLVPQSAPAAQTQAAPAPQAAAAAVENVVEHASAVVTAQVAPRIAATGESVDTAAISAAAREMIERVVWEVVPEMAEALIKEEIARLLAARR